MSNENTNEQSTNEQAPAKVKRTKRDTYTVGQLAVKRAKARGIDTSRAAKDVRGRLRGNWSTIVKLDPSILKHKSEPNDGNRWPVLNQRVADFVLSTSANKHK